MWLKLFYDKNSLLYKNNIKYAKGKYFLKTKKEKIECTLMYS